jgi:hypothetical protein
MFHSGRAAAVAAWLVLAAVGESRAAHFWSNPAGGLYSAPGNWMGGVPIAGQPVFYNVDGTYTVDVDVNATHGATQFSAGNANVTLNITGPGYSIPALVKIGSAGTTNNVSVSGSTFSTGNVEIAPVVGSTAGLTLSGPMQADILSVGGQISATGPPGPPWPEQTFGGMGALTLNPGANLTADALLAESAGFGSEITFNGGTLTIAGHARPGSTLDRIGDGTNSAVLNLYNGAGYSYHNFGNGTLTISNNAILNFDSPDGELVVGNIVSEGGGSPGEFNWIAGYLALFSAPAEISASSILGSNLDLTSLRFLQAPSIVVRNGSSLTFSGSQVFTDSLVTETGGATTFFDGLLFINQADLSIGPGGITNPAGVLLEAGDFIGVEAGELFIAAGRSITVNGGSFRASTIANDGVLAFSSGGINITGGGLTIGPTGQLNSSPNISLGAGSSLQAYYGEIAIELSQSVSIDGGAFIAGSLTNNGTLVFNAGVLAVTQSSLTIGPTGQLRHQPLLTINNGSSIQMLGQAITIQSGQTVHLQNGFMRFGSMQIDGTFNVNDRVSGFSTMTSGPNSQVTFGAGSNVGGGTFVRKDLVVTGGSSIFSEMSTPTSGAHDNSLTLIGGRVYADTMKIGAAPGFVDTVTIDGGELVTANLQAAGGASSVIIFKAGRFTSFNSNVDGPGTLVIGDGVSDALFDIGAGTHTFADGLAISTNARMRGGGTINGDVSNSGTMEPGNSFGTLTINGDFENAGVLKLEFSTALPFLDKVVVNGTFDAGGVMQILAYDPDIGDSYDVMDFTSFIDSGFTFDFNPTTLPANSHWDISEFATTGQIYIVADNGDFNNDGVVDMADYVAWSKGARVPSTAGNFDLWKGHFGENSGAGSAANGTVPESSALALWLTGAAMIRLRRGWRGEPRR